MGELDSNFGIELGEAIDAYRKLFGEHGGWSVVGPDQKIPAPEFQIIAYNPNLGLRGVSMNIVNEGHYGLEVLFDDFDSTTADKQFAQILDLGQAYKMPYAKIQAALKSPDIWEELGERYGDQFLRLPPHEIDIPSLFSTEEGVQRFSDLVFADFNS
jgi:hypothetical protein